MKIDGSNIQGHSLTKKAELMFHVPLWKETKFVKECFNVHIAKTGTT